MNLIPNALLRRSSPMHLICFIDLLLFIKRNMIGPPVTTPQQAIHTVMKYLINLIPL